MSKEYRPGKSRLFINMPTELYKALVEAARQNYCTKTTYVIRSLILGFQQDAIKYHGGKLPDDNS